jgi:hypothetical protein
MRNLLIFASLILLLIISACATPAPQPVEVTKYYNVTCYNYGVKVYDDHVRSVRIVQQIANTNVTATLSLLNYSAKSNLTVILPETCIYLEERKPD